MDIKEIREALTRAASLFKAAGSKPQSQSIEAVERLLGESGDATIEEFVDKTCNALNQPSLVSISAAEIVERIAELGIDQLKFASLFKQMQSRDFGKDKAFEVASHFTGARITSWKSKPKALAAIRAKFDERAYLASKDRLNERVTPW